MPTPKETSHTVMPLGEHLEELRKRVFWAIAGVLPILGAGLYFGKDILKIIVRPLERAMRGQGETLSMQTTALFEGFNTWVKVGLLVTIVFGAPWILYQFWRFVSPGLYLRERRFVRVLAPLSVILTIVGMLFLYFVVLTFALDFFVHFNKTLMTRSGTPVVTMPEGVRLPSVPVLAGDPPAPKAGEMWINRTLGQLRIAVGEPAPASSATAPDGAGSARPPAPPVVFNLPLQTESLVSQHYKISEYLSTVLTFAIAFAIAFQTPVVVLLLGWVGIIRPETMRKQRKYAFLACTVIGALCAPPDPISMLALMFPLYGLYELGLLLLRLMPATKVAAGSVLSAAPAGGGSGDGASEGGSGSDADDDPYTRPDDR